MISGFHSPASDKDSFDFSGELSEGAESTEDEENKNKIVDGEFIPAAHDHWRFYCT